MVAPVFDFVAAALGAAITNRGGQIEARRLD